MYCTTFGVLKSLSEPGTRVRVLNLGNGAMLTVATLHWNEFWARGVSHAKVSENLSLVVVGTRVFVSGFQLQPLRGCCSQTTPSGMRSASCAVFLRHLGNAVSAGRSSCGSRNLIVKQVWAAAVVLNSIGVASPPSNIYRISRAPHQAFPGARALITSMAHKGASEVEKDATGHLKIDVAGKAVEVVGVSGVSDTDIRKALESGPFQRWLDYMKGPSGILSLGGSGGARCSLNRVLIQSVDFFGQRVGFVKFKAEVIDDETGAKLPGIVFARGGAVAILMLLECEGKKYAVLTEQARVPVGRAIMELPAGMLDDDAGDFVGTAAREVEEETGIHVKTSDLVDLTALLDESTGRKMFPSPGGSDEEITLFLYRCHVEKEVIDSLQGQDTGLRDHGELIKVHVVPYDTLWRISPDSKVLAAIAIYETALRLNLLPTPPNSPDLSHM